MERTGKHISAKAKKKRVFLLICIGLAFTGLIAWTVWGNTALEVTEITVASDRLPAAFSGYRIAQISDLHNAEFGKENKKLLLMLSSCEPDCIVITGDLIDSRRTKIDVALHFAQKAADIAPVYYVSGNHEARIDEAYDELRAGLADVGVTVLENDVAFLEQNGERVRLIGLSDPDFTIRGDFFEDAPAMFGAELDKLSGDGAGYTILLSHRPELFDTYVSRKMDLVLSGHAHGGQFRLPFIGGLYAPGQGFFPKYDAGLYAEETTSMVVSRGLGNSIIPLRFNNRPEIVLLVLAKNEN